MAEQHLDNADVGAGFEQMSSEAVAQSVDGNGLSSLAAARAMRQVDCSTLGSSGRLSSWPGNSQCAGRVSRQ